MKFDLWAFDIEKFDSILARGLSSGLGIPGQQVCIEAAICEVLGMAHGDNPECVEPAVRSFKIRLNDSIWSGTIARAEGLRSLGLAQLGSAGVVNGADFTNRIAEMNIRVLIPTLVRELCAGSQEMLEAAYMCEKEGTIDAAEKAYRKALYANKHNKHDPALVAAHNASRVATFLSINALPTLVASVAEAAQTAANAGKFVNSDKYLLMSAKFALDTLREMNSPGVQLLG